MTGRKEEGKNERNEQSRRRGSKLEYRKTKNIDTRTRKQEKTKRQE
jgi:hypothetical protein